MVRLRKTTSGRYIYSKGLKRVHLVCKKEYIWCVKKSTFGCCEYQCFCLWRLYYLPYCIYIYIYVLIITICVYWQKVLLHRSSGSESAYLPVNVTSYNQDLYLLCWSQTVAALSYVFENAEEKAIVVKAINGFRSFVCEGERVALS